MARMRSPLECFGPEWISPESGRLPILFFEGWGGSPYTKSKGKGCILFFLLSTLIGEENDGFAKPNEE